MHFCIRAAEINEFIWLIQGNPVQSQFNACGAAFVGHWTLLVVALLQTGLVVMKGSEAAINMNS